MAPTSVLAEQHYMEFSERLQGLDIGIILLSSKMKRNDRQKALKDIQKGSSIIIGTHAVLSTEVQIPFLGLTVVDEEHRFGVEQRELLREKASNGIHYLSMSATPIPRTIANALYGNILKPSILKPCRPDESR